MVTPGQELCGSFGRSRQVGKRITKQHKLSAVYAVSGKPSRIRRLFPIREICAEPLIRNLNNDDCSKRPVRHSVMERSPSRTLRDIFGLIASYQLHFSAIPPTVRHLNSHLLQQLGSAVLSGTMANVSPAYKFIMLRHFDRF